MKGVSLRSAHLGGANLRGTQNLTQDQLGTACGSNETKLDPRLTIRRSAATKQRRGLRPAKNFAPSLAVIGAVGDVVRQERATDTAGSPDIRSFPQRCR